MVPFISHARTSIVFGPGVRIQLGPVARELGFHRSLLVADPGMVSAGYVEQVQQILEDDGVHVEGFHDLGENPDSRMVEAGAAAAAAHAADSIIALGGGSSMDCAKGINFVYTNGGPVHQYRGHGRTAKPMLPMIAVPTTTGTGSEAQSYALLSDASTHIKMACGAPGAAFRYALLDPELALTQPARILAMTGYDAISHAVETCVTTKHNEISAMLSKEAWRLLNGHFEQALTRPDLECMGAMQLGSYLAGAAIENSMLGAAHATANPLTARYGVTHGAAIALMLPHVTRWNHDPRHRELHPDLPLRLEELRAAAKLSATHTVPAADLDGLCQDAAAQWTGTFNPRPFGAAAARELYQCALSFS